MRCGWRGFEIAQAACLPGAPIIRPLWRATTRATPYWRGEHEKLSLQQFMFVHGHCMRQIKVLSGGAIEPGLQAAAMRRKTSAIA